MKYKLPEEWPYRQMTAEEFKQFNAWFFDLSNWTQGRWILYHFINYVCWFLFFYCVL